MAKRLACRSSIHVLAFTIFMSILFVGACGGGGGGPDTRVAETRAVSNELASATTLTAMDRAVGHLIARTDFDNLGSSGPNGTPIMPAEVRDAYTKGQLLLPESMYTTVSHAFAAISADSRLKGLLPTQTTDQVIATINSRLPAAYADIGPSKHAMLVLMTSKPGRIPSVAPMVTGDTRLSPVQVMMFVQFLCEDMLDRSWCTAWCYAKCAAVIALIVAMDYACTSQPEMWPLCAEVTFVAEEKARNDLNACLAACHAQ